MTKTIYLANPYGFSVQQKALLLPPIVAALEELGSSDAIFAVANGVPPDEGVEVWEPFARNNQVDFLEAGWAYRIGQSDFRDVVSSDAIFAVANGVALPTRASKDRARCLTRLSSGWRLR